MEVKLLNPEVVKETLAKVGRFASICKTENEISEAAAVKIGKHCLSSGHFSPCRGIMWSFQVTGISRVCSHQLVRHHVGVAINQASGVFQEADLEAEVVVPPSVQMLMKKDPSFQETYNSYINLGKQLYSELKANGVTNSDARYHMPQSSPTAVNIAVTPEALIHIANERLCYRAQWEIRSVVREMCKQIVEIEPYFEDMLQPKCMRLNGCPETYGCGFYNTRKNNSMTMSSPVEKRPIEKQLSLFTCTKCKRTVHVKEDDVEWVDHIKTGEPFYCRECRREISASTEKGDLND